jgi:hypothetical protein
VNVVDIHCHILPGNEAFICPDLADPAQNCGTRKR